MATMRAKMKVEAITQHEAGEDLKFHAVCKTGGYPGDGSDEDNTYAKFSPSAELTISIRNPALFGKFKPGEKYYVDFTQAES